MDEGYLAETTHWVYEYLQHELQTDIPITWESLALISLHDLGNH
jgi:hypothetical protein